MRLSIHNLFRDVICKKRGSALFNILLLPLMLASYIFLGLIEARRFSYRIGLLKSSRLNCKVISIGNLTVGGTGKTPFVIFL
ncbi:MAG: tetraacyldisaccharide 4'-kinase, partial [Nitrospirota bacterium]